MRESWAVEASHAGPCGLLDSSRAFCGKEKRELPTLRGPRCRKQNSLAAPTPPPASGPTRLKSMCSPVHAVLPVRLVSPPARWLSHFRACPRSVDVSQDLSSPCPLVHSRPRPSVPCSVTRFCILYPSASNWHAYQVCKSRRSKNCQILICKNRSFWCTYCSRNVTSLNSRAVV